MVRDGRRPLLAVIADDLTGAADTGVQFQHVAPPVHLGGPGLIQEPALKAVPGTLAIFTETRNMEAKKAGRIISQTAEAIRRIGPEVIYKKIDSCLRGHIGLEVDGLLKGLGLAASFIAPAFPRQGRTTVADIHYVNGIPLAQSDMGQDPLYPMTGSRLSRIVAATGASAVGHVCLEDLGLPLNQLTAKVEGMLRAGLRHLVFDALQQEHLDRVALLAVREFANILPVGSAGLAQSMADCLDVAHDLPSLGPAAPKGSPQGRFLLVCGSISPTSAAQTEILAKQGGLRRLVLSPDQLLVPSAAKENSAIASLAAMVAEHLDKGDLILQLDPAGKRLDATAGDRLLRSFARIIACSMAKGAVGALFLSGGDTATAVLRTLDSQVLELEGEVLNGIVKARVLEGRLSGLPVITKSGAFGRTNTLLELYSIWQKERFAK